MRKLAPLCISLLGALFVSGCEEPAPFPYEYLASETNNPFLKFGEPPKKAAHKAAAQRWPDARSCLVESERSNPKPDIRKFDWLHLRSIEEGEVCIFRIFSSIRSMEGAMDWLKSQGYRLEKPRDANYKIYVRKNGGGRMLNSGIGIKKEEKENTNKNILRNALYKNMFHAQTISSTWTHDNKLLDVHIVFNAL